MAKLNEAYISAIHPFVFENFVVFEGKRHSNKFLNFEL